MTREQKLAELTAERFNCAWWRRRLEDAAAIAGRRQLLVTSLDGANDNDRG